MSDSRIINLFDKNKYNRQLCLSQLKARGFEHQDECSFCRQRMEMAWLIVLYTKQALRKHYPKDYEIKGDDIQDVLLTALNNIGIDPALFKTHLKD